MLNTDWSLFQLRIGTGKLADLGTQAIRVLKSRGVILPAGSRLERAVEIVSRLNTSPDIIRADDPKILRLTLEALRTVFQSFVICWTLTERPRRVVPFPAERLKYLGKGADLPAKDSKPWDTQFELMVGANLILGGADLEPQEPPDCTLLYHGRRVGVEAKRLTSLKGQKVRDGLRDAAKAFLNTTGEGFVAFNLDNWIEEFIPVTDPEEFGKAFDSQVREAHKQIQAASERRALLGAFVFGTRNEWRFGDGKPQLVWQNPMQLIGFGDEGSREHPDFLAFFGPLRERWEASMTELGRYLHPSP